jgi:hypothetical protein
MACYIIPMPVVIGLESYALSFVKNAYQHFGLCPSSGGLSLKETVWAVSALGNFAYLIKYRRPYEKDLWTGSMSVFKKDYECTMVSNSKNII